MKYAPHNALIGPARASSDLRRLSLGILITILSFLSLSYVYASLAHALAPVSAWGEHGLGIVQASTPWGVLINLYVFATLIGALWLTVILVHGRSLRGLFGPPRLAMQQFARVALGLLGLYLMLALLPTSEALRPQPSLGLGRWLGFLPLALGGLLIQVTAEELVFRGYLQSQLAARFRHPVLWIGLPSLVFAALHYAPAQMGGAAWMVVLWAGLFGLAAADLTARSGTLGPAIALHLANNSFAILITAPIGAFNGLALYTYPAPLDTEATLWLTMPVDMMMLLCSWLAARLILRR